MNEKNMTHEEHEQWIQLNSQQAQKHQVGGNHYVKLEIQPWDAMKCWMTHEEFKGFLRGNAIKYLARDKDENVLDLRKARHYIDKLIEELICQ